MVETSCRRALPCGLESPHYVVVLLRAHRLGSEVETERHHCLTFRCCEGRDNPRPSQTRRPPVRAESTTATSHPDRRGDQLELVCATPSSAHTRKGSAEPAGHSQI